MFDTNIDTAAATKAEKDAQRMVNKGFQPHEMRIMFQRIIANHISIGLWDKYFDDLNDYQIALEAFLILEDMNRQNNDNIPEDQVREEIEKMKQAKKKGLNVAIPPGFEDLFSDD